MTTSNTQLTNKLREFPKFRGVFPQDELKFLGSLKPGEAIIANFESPPLNGSHWTCAINHPVLGKFYIDSFGYVPPITFQDFLMEKNESFKFNRIQYQEITSKNCGEFSTYFVSRFLMGLPLNDIFNLDFFPSDKNEKTVLDWFNSL
jgi:hypothetical protein